MRPSVTSSADGEAAASSSQSSSTRRHRRWARYAVHEDGVLLDRVRQLDERLELDGRGVEVPEAVLHEAGQLADAAPRRAARRAPGAGAAARRGRVRARRRRPPRAAAGSRNGAPPPAEAQDLGLDVGRALAPAPDRFGTSAARWPPRRRGRRRLGACVRRPSAARGRRGAARALGLVASGRPSAFLVRRPVGSEPVAARRIPTARTRPSPAVPDGRSPAPSTRSGPRVTGRRAPVRRTSTGRASTPSSPGGPVRRPRLSPGAPGRRSPPLRARLRAPPPLPARPRAAPSLRSPPVRSPLERPALVPPASRPVRLLPARGGPPPRPAGRRPRRSSGSSRRTPPVRPAAARGLRAGPSHPGPATARAPEPLFPEPLSSRIRLLPDPVFRGPLCEELGRARSSFVVVRGGHRRSVPADRPPTPMERGTHGRKRRRSGRDEAPRPETGRRRFELRNPGGDLLSQGVSPQVPSARAVFTAVFGMGTGVSPPLWPPETCCQSLSTGPEVQGERTPERARTLTKEARARKSQALGRLVPVG